MLELELNNAHLSSEHLTDVDYLSFCVHSEKVAGSRRTQQHTASSPTEPEESHCSLCRLVVLSCVTEKPKVLLHGFKTLHETVSVPRSPRLSFTCFVYVKPVETRRRDPALRKVQSCMKCSNYNNNTLVLIQESEQSPLQENVAKKGNTHYV